MIYGRRIRPVEGGRRLGPARTGPNSEWRTVAFQHAEARRDRRTTRPRRSSPVGNTCTRHTTKGTCRRACHRGTALNNRDLATSPRQPPRLPAERPGGRPQGTQRRDWAGLVSRCDYGPRWRRKQLAFGGMADRPVLPEKVQGDGLPSEAPEGREDWWRRRESLREREPKASVN
jgi:hypothetical protein